MKGKSYCSDNSTVVTARWWTQLTPSQPPWKPQRCFPLLSSHYSHSQLQLTPFYLWPHILCQSLPLMQPVSFEEMTLSWVHVSLSNQLSSVQSLSCVLLFATPWTAACQASLSITSSQSSPKLMSIELVMPSSHLILCHPLLLPSIFPSIRVISNEWALCIRWPKYWRFSFNISPSNEHPGLISFRMNWLDLLAVQGTLKSLLQHHSSKASVLRRSDFFILQLSHP